MLLLNAHMEHISISRHRNQVVDTQLLIVAIWDIGICVIFNYFPIFSVKILAMLNAMHCPIML